MPEIKQVSYKVEKDDPSELIIMSSDDSNLEIKYDTNFKGQKYNTLKRHVYLPSVEDMASVGKSVRSMCVTRDSEHTNPNFYWVSALSIYDGFFSDSDSISALSSMTNHAQCLIHPSFIVDLSKVDYELVK